jgi:RNA polymerase sigma-70 factor (ECF subfamily)
MESKQPARETDPDLGSLRPMLVKMARRFADRIDAEDLVQEAFARALERRGALRPGTDFKVWMKPVIRNLAIDEGRKRKRFRPLEEVRAPGVSAPVPAADPAWTAFDADDVRRALAHCPDELRTTFELHYWQLLPLDAIATQLGVARATIGTRLFRARAYVRRTLERDVASCAP